MAFTGQSKNLHILAEMFSLDILYLKGKSPLLMRTNQVKFGDMLPETSKSSAFWDMVVNSHLKWLLLFSPDEGGKSDGTSLAFWHLHKSRLCVVPYTGLDLLEPLAGGDVIKWVKTEQVV